MEFNTLYGAKQASSENPYQIKSFKYTLLKEMKGRKLEKSALN